MAGDALRRTVKVDAVQPPATPRPSDRFGNAVPCGYAALEWSGSTWRIKVGLSNLPRITSAAATQHLSKRPLRKKKEEGTARANPVADHGISSDEKGDGLIDRPVFPPTRAPPPSYCIFQEPWWLDAVAAGAWQSLEVTRGTRVVARMPIVPRRIYGFTIIRQPPLTPTLGPWIELSGTTMAKRLTEEKKTIQRSHRSIAEVGLHSAELQSSDYQLASLLLERVKADHAIHVHSEQYFRPRSGLARAARERPPAYPECGTTPHGSQRSVGRNAP